jgi:hypothetical protein
MPRPSSFESTIRPILLRFAHEIARAVEKATPKESAGGGRRRSLNPEIVYKALKGAKNGSAVGALADKLGAQKSRVSAALQKLRSEKRAKIVGVKRNAKWHAA